MPDSCPKCGYSIPPQEPPVGTWVVDRFGATHYRKKDGWSPRPSGWDAFGRWDAMWDARGPLVVCGPYGEALDEAIGEDRD